MRTKTQEADGDGLAVAARSIFSGVDQESSNTWVDCTEIDKFASSIINYEPLSLDPFPGESLLIDR